MGRRGAKVDVLPLGTVCAHPCPECGERMVLRASRYGLFYGCERFPLCNAAHGAHRDTGKPLGVPADAETKRARIRAHDAFDTLWKTGRTVRGSTVRDSRDVRTDGGRRSITNRAGNLRSTWMTN
jgi:hypothetical protein